MSLEEKILFLQEELSKDPNSYHELKKEVEDAFNIDVNLWESYEKGLDNGYQLTRFTLLTGRHCFDSDVITGNYTNIYVTNYVALMPMCLVNNLPYFQDYVPLANREEFEQYIKGFKKTFTDYLTYGESQTVSKNNPDDFYKLMKNANVVLKDLITWGKTAVLETTTYNCHIYCDGDSVTNYDVKKSTALGKFITDENGLVTFGIVCPDIKDDIIELAKRKNAYERGRQLINRKPSE